MADGQWPASAKGVDFDSLGKASHKPLAIGHSHKNAAKLVFFLVPINLLCRKHSNSQNNEEADASHKQGITLQLQQNIYESVEYGQQETDAQGGLFVLGDGGHEDHDHPDSHHAGDEIGEPEIDMLGERQQERVEDGERDADK